MNIDTKDIAKLLIKFVSTKSAQIKQCESEGVDKCAVISDERKVLERNNFSIQFGKSLAKHLKMLPGDDLQFLAEMFTTSASELCPKSLLCDFYGPKGLSGIRVKKILASMDLELKTEIAENFVQRALEIDVEILINALVSSTSFLKLQAGNNDGAALLAQWLLAKPKIIKALLPDNCPSEVFVRKLDYHYVPDYFGARYKKLPHLSDLPVFGGLASRAISAGNSSLYFDRLYTLYNVLARLAFSEGGRGGFAIAEVGVYRGGTSVFLLEAMAALGLISCTFHACDTYCGHFDADIDSQVDWHSSGQFSNTDADYVRNLLSPFPSAYVHVGRIQDSAHELPQRFGLVHLDVDLYEPTLFGLEFFYQRLVLNGAIIVDDYGSKFCPGVDKAVEIFASKNSDAFVMPMLTGQCLIMRSVGSS